MLIHSYFPPASILFSFCCLCCVPAMADAQRDDLKMASESIVESTNAFRAEQGLDRLVVNESLQKAAADFAQFMAEESKYGHEADGRRPADRAEAAGYDYCVVRENIAYRMDPGAPNAAVLSESFFNGWKESEEHRESMLAKHVSDTGVAIATIEGQTFYAVQLFGRPESAKFELEITNGLEASQVIVFRTDDSKDRIDVPPGATLKVTRCIPTVISLAPVSQEPGAQDSGGERHAVGNDASFVIKLNPMGNAILEARQQ
jgi:hypothetical protein